MVVLPSQELALTTSIFDAAAGPSKNIRLTLTLADSECDARNPLSSC